MKKLLHLLTLVAFLCRPAMAGGPIPGPPMPTNTTHFSISGGAGNTSYLEMATGSSSAVSAAGKGKIIYNELTNKFQVSTNGGAFADLGGGGCANLPSCYTAGSGPGPQTIPIDATRLGIVVKDALAPISGSLFSIQNNAGTLKFLDVKSSGVLIQGDTDAFASGPLTLQAVNAGGVGVALTLDATPTGVGALKYSFLSTGSGASAGAGAFAIYNGGAYVFSITGNATTPLTTGLAIVNAASGSPKLMPGGGSSFVELRAGDARLGSTSSNYLGFGYNINGFEVNYGGIRQLALMNGGTNSYTSGVADGATAIGHVIDTANPLVTIGAEVVEFRSGNTKIGSLNPVLFGGALKGMKLEGEGTLSILQLSDNNGVYFWYNGDGFGSHLNYTSPEVIIGGTSRITFTWNGAYSQVNGAAGPVALYDNTTTGLYAGSGGVQFLVGGGSAFLIDNSSGVSALYPNGNNVADVGSPSHFMRRVASTRFYGVEQTIPAAASITLDPASGESIRVALGATAITTVNAGTGLAGERMVVQIIQDATGGRSISGWSASFALQGGSYTVSPAANAIDILTFVWDATTSKWVETSRRLDAGTSTATTLQAAYTAMPASSPATIVEDSTRQWVQLNDYGTFASEPTGRYLLALDSSDNADWYSFAVEQATMWAQNIGTSYPRTTKFFLFDNATLATVGAPQQWGIPVVLQARAYNTTTTTSQSVFIGLQARSNSGAPTDGYLAILGTYNNGIDLASPLAEFHTGQTNFLRSFVTSTGTAVGLALDTGNALASGDKLVSIRNNTTEKFYVDYNGNLWANGASVTLGASPTINATSGTLSLSATSLLWTTKQLTWTESADASTGIHGYLYTAGAHTSQPTGTEKTDWDWNIARTETWATGAITTQRFMRVRQPTMAFAAASTVTNAATFYIDGAPVAGTNATITNAYALWIAAGAVRVDSGSISGPTSGTTPFTLTTAYNNTVSSKAFVLNNSTAQTGAGAELLQMQNGGSEVGAFRFMDQVAGGNGWGWDFQSYSHITTRGADGATAVGLTIRNYSAFSTNGAKLVSFLNNTTEKFSLTREGYSVNAGATPTCFVDTAQLGTGATCSVTGTAQYGRITITAGTGPSLTANTTFFTLTLPQAFPTSAIMTIRPTEVNSAGVTYTTWYISTNGTTQLIIKSNTTGANGLFGSTAYTFAYRVDIW